MMEQSGIGKLVERVQELTWFHSMDLGGYCISPGRLVNRPPNLTLFSAMDLFQYIDMVDMDCIDVGCGDGIIAFGMKMRGARKVLATDMGIMRETFRIARTLLNLDVDYVGNTSFNNILETVPSHNADIMMCGGVFYHMLNPFDCILKARKILKKDGILVLESAYYSSDKEATLDFTPVSARSKEITTYWMPSKSAVLGMLRLAGFDILAIRSISVPDRIAVAARNVSFNDVRHRLDSTRDRHNHGIQDPSLIAEVPGTKSSVKWHGPEDDIELDWETYCPEFPPHPSGKKFSP